MDSDASASERTMTITVTGVGLDENLWADMCDLADTIARNNDRMAIVSETRRGDDGRGHERYIAKPEG